MTRRFLSSSAGLFFPFALMVTGGVEGLQGQVLFDWPVQAEAGPPALQRGGASLLWNPSGFARSVRERPEVWVVHIDGPGASGIQGLAGAVVIDLPLVGRVGAAYQHLGIPDIDRTSDSPEPEPGSLTVTEDVAILGLARGLGPRAGFGVSLRAMQATVGSRRKTRVAADLGVQSEFEGSLRPRLGAAIRSVGTHSDLLAGATVEVPTPWPERLSTAVGYGVQGVLSRFDPDHRLTVRGILDDVFVLGVAAQSNRSGPWTPLWEIRLDVDRYSLAVVRESLPNDFGVSHYFQATIGLN